MPKIMAAVFKQLLTQKYRNAPRHMRQVKRLKSIVPVYPLAIERQYAAAIKTALAKPLNEALWASLKEENYNRWLKDYARHDSASYRADEYENEINKVIGTLQIADQSIFDNPLATKDAVQKAVVGTYLHSKGQWQKETAQYVGVPFSTDEGWWAKTRTAWVNQNLNLIKSQSPEVIKKIEQTVYEGVRKGTMYSDLSQQLTAITGFTSGGEDTKKGLSAKAELIARDQVGKLQGQMTRYRQEEIGVDKYKWLAMGDERECDICGQLDGKMYRWDDASVQTEDNGKTWFVRPAEFMGLTPGNAHPQCRCTALAVMDELLDEVQSEVDEQDAQQAELGRPEGFLGQEDALTGLAALPDFSGVGWAPKDAKAISGLFSGAAEGPSDIWGDNRGKDILNAFSDAKVKKIKAGELFATQKFVSEEKITALLKEGVNIKENPISIIEYKGKKYIYDGHHRTVVLKLLGKEEIVAKVALLP